ncbi:hypothetical protein LZ31DRAFT_275549 [Colletotrichum somersetense]|nr:hypothetical protein LZ31DRAFT_275549 [Colletotrichum somersetense]
MRPPDPDGRPQPPGVGYAQPNADNQSTGPGPAPAPPFVFPEARRLLFRRWLFFRSKAMEERRLGGGEVSRIMTCLKAACSAGAFHHTFFYPSFGCPIYKINTGRSFQPYTGEDVVSSPIAFIVGIHSHLPIFLPSFCRKKR